MDDFESLTIEQVIDKLIRVANELEDILESSQEFFHKPENFKSNLGSALDLINIAIEQLNPSEEKDEGF